MQAKRQLAVEIVGLYHGTALARETLEEWNVRFSEKRLGDTALPEFRPRHDETLNIVVAAYLESFHLEKSRAEASRLIKQGSVQLNGAKLIEPKTRIDLQPGQVLRLDKTHAVRVK